MFDELLARVDPRIAKNNTNFSKAIKPGVKLTATLRHLVSGIGYSSLSYNFRVSCHMVATFLPGVCQAIVNEYKLEVISHPSTTAEWKAIADNFERRWNVPHEKGLNCNHVHSRKPASSGSLYDNYKMLCSFVLPALVNTNCMFLWIDNGAAKPLTIGDFDVPYFFLSDDAFALKPYFMKPYTRRGLTKKETICNYRTSHARRVVEKAFGILSSHLSVARFLLVVLQYVLSDVLSLSFRGRSPLQRMGLVVGQPSSS
ncbi:uncharacterized protein [Palaemon carinicauda]|uniref:uncharacterized protein n=1 Tax=Palaemon carinicauda TaxID=392227 RepID=UPI0035B60416